MTEQERITIASVAKDLSEIKTVLVGIPNTEDGGLVAQINRYGKRLSKLERVVMVGGGFLIGMGVLKAPEIIDVIAKMGI